MINVPGNVNANKVLTTVKSITPDNFNVRPCYFSAMALKHDCRHKPVFAVLLFDFLPGSYTARLYMECLQSYLAAQGYAFSASLDSVSESSTSPPVAKSSTCTGSHHFGHWCHTSISRGGIIAVIVIGSLALIAALATTVFVVMWRTQRGPKQVRCALWLLVAALLVMCGCCPPSQQPLCSISKYKRPQACAYAGSLGAMVSLPHQWFSDRGAAMPLFEPAVLRQPAAGTCIWHANALSAGHIP